jgi:hypothetical protein
METMMINRKEILTLLLADMRNRKLILGLEAAGLNPADFYTGLTDLILQKMGFDPNRDEHLSEWYEQTLENIIDKELPYFMNHQRELALTMYELLLAKKDTIEPLKKGLKLWLGR